MQFHALDPVILSRAGRVLQALCRWFGENPADRHPTVDQLAAVLSSNRKFVQRGLQDLAAAGLIFINADPNHPVNRTIDLAPAVAGLAADAVASCHPPAAGGVTVVSGGDTVGAPSTPGGDASGVTEVSALRSSNQVRSEVDVSRRGDTSGMGGRGPQLPEAKPIADPLERIMRRFSSDVAAQVAGVATGPRVAQLGHLERQGQLPIGPPASAAAAPPDGKLIPVVARLEAGGPEALDAVGPAVLKLSESFGEAFEGVYRKVANGVALGRYPFAALVEAIEEASRPDVRHRGAAFAAASARCFPGLIALRAKVVTDAEKPAAESSAKIPPTAGRSAFPPTQSILTGS